MEWSDVQINEIRLVPQHFVPEIVEAVNPAKDEICIESTLHVRGQQAPGLAEADAVSRSTVPEETREEVAKRVEREASDVGFNLSMIKRERASYVFDSKFDSRTGEIRGTPWELRDL